jgi:hypothetical protein
MKRTTAAFGEPGTKHLAHVASFRPSTFDKWLEAEHKCSWSIRDPRSRKPTSNLFTAAAFLRGADLDAQG